MQINDELSIKKQIQAKAFSSLYFVYGDESYLASHYANTLASSITDTSGMSFNYYYFDSETVNFDSFYEACETLPMMSDRVCVFVKDFPFLKTAPKPGRSTLQNAPRIFLFQVPQTANRFR